MQIRATLLAVFVALGTGLQAQMMKSADAGDKGTDAASADPVLDEAAQQIGRALFLRCLCVGENLGFDAQGRLTPGTKTRPVDWTLDGVDVTRVERKSPESVELDGVRVAVRWDDNAKQFQRHEFKDQFVKIVLSGDADRVGMEHTIRAVFSVGMDHAFQLSTPPYWQHYFFPRMPWPADPELGTGAIAVAGTKVNGVDVEPPAPTKKAASMFTEEASRDHVQGPVVLQVTVDDAGHPHRVAVVTPLGYGLDAAAVEAMDKSAFAPPAVAGKPAPVLVLVKENFVVQTPPGQ